MKIFLCVFFLGVLPASATELWLKVVAVESGDLLSGIDESAKTYTVRLSGIDAPERRQGYFEESRKALAQPLIGQWVKVQWTLKTAKGELLGRVSKKKTDYNLGQVTQGYAWAAPRVGDLSEADQKIFEQAQSVAKQTARGLWAERNPVAPWDFTHRNLTGPVGKSK